MALVFVDLSVLTSFPSFDNEILLKVSYKILLRNHEFLKTRKYQKKTQSLVKTRSLALVFWVGTPPPPPYCAFKWFLTYSHCISGIIYTVLDNICQSVYMYLTIVSKWLAITQFICVSNLLWWYCDLLEIFNWKRLLSVRLNTSDLIYPYV
jgi:hypothetical protein